MRKIEEQLSYIHSMSNDSSSSPSSRTDDIYNLPIAKVASVSPGSPADEAVSYINAQEIISSNRIISTMKLFLIYTQGLKIEDSILSFGSVRFENFTDIRDIANVVQHSLNQLVKVIVDRDEKILKLYLKPHKWSGPGVLGCNILPCEQVER